MVRGVPTEVGWTPTAPCGLVREVSETKPPRRGADAASSIVFVLALTQGVVPLVSKLLFGGAPIWASSARLASPWWWITASGLIVAAALVLDALDRPNRPGAPDA